MRNYAEDAATVGNVDVAIGTKHETEQAALPTGIPHDYRSQLAAGLDELHKLKPEALHRLRIMTKKVRYLTEFTASRYDGDAAEKWLHWLKKAQDVLGSRNDRAMAVARIDGLCDAIAKRHGKVRRTLHAVLDDHALPALDLAPLPAPYWR